MNILTAVLFVLFFTCTLIVVIPWLVYYIDIEAYFSWCARKQDLMNIRRKEKKLAKLEKISKFKVGDFVMFDGKSAEVIKLGLDYNKILSILLDLPGQTKLNFMFT